MVHSRQEIRRPRLDPVQGVLRSTPARQANYLNDSQDELLRVPLQGHNGDNHSQEDAWKV